MFAASGQSITLKPSFHDQELVLQVHEAQDGSSTQGRIRSRHTEGGLGIQPSRTEV